MEQGAPIDELNDVFRAFEAVEDLLCPSPGAGLNMLEPANLSSLLRIIRERGEAQLARLRERDGRGLRQAA